MEIGQKGEIFSGPKYLHADTEESEWLPQNLIDFANTNGC
jgi:hypothetical protein